MELTVEAAPEVVLVQSNGAVEEAAWSVVCCFKVKGDAARRMHQMSEVGSEKKTKDMIREVDYVEPAQPPAVPHHIKCADGTTAVFCQSAFEARIQTGIQFIRRKNHEILL
jgi:nitrate reductase cytochrome c-type subunit